MVGICVGMARKAAPMPVSLRYTLTRKRPPSDDTYEKSMSLPSRRCFCWFWVSTSETPARRRSEEHSLNSSHANISYAVFCLKKKKKQRPHHSPSQHQYPK